MNIRLKMRENIVGLQNLFLRKKIKIKNGKENMHRVFVFLIFFLNL